MFLPEFLFCTVPALHAGAPGSFMLSLVFIAIVRCFLETC